jgi:hypothetical protein
LLLIAKTDGKLYSFGASDNLEASFRLPQLELNPGRASHVRNSRIIGNMTSAQVSIDCRARMGDAASTCFDRLQEQRRVSIGRPGGISSPK